MRPAHALRTLPLGVIVAAVTAIAALAAGATYWALDDSDSGDEPSSTITLDSAPAGADSLAALDVVDYDRSEVALADVLDGKPTVINFFASTCVPCITEMPAFEAVHRELGDRLAFLGLAVNDRPEDAQEIVGTTGVTYRTLLDPQGAAITFFGAIQLPATVFVDASGTVLELRNGALSATELRSTIDEVFEV